MIKAHIITRNPNNLFPQALAIALQHTEHYQASTISYTDMPHTQSYKDILPIFLWHKNEEKEIIQSIEIVRHTQENVCIITQSDISREQIKNLISQGKTIIVSMGITIKELHHHIENLHSGNSQYIFSPDVLTVLMEQLLAQDKEPVIINLNHQENRIVDCARKGYTLEQTAKELCLSKNTIAAYRSKILQKTGTKSINQLIARYNE